MKSEFYYSDDYAGFSAGNLSFYYGYEVVKEIDGIDDEWCFQVKNGKKEIFIATSTELEKSVKSCPFRDARDYLMAGIILWINSEKLQKKKENK